MKKIFKFSKVWEESTHKLYGVILIDKREKEYNFIYLTTIGWCNKDFKKINSVKMMNLLDDMYWKYQKSQLPKSLRLAVRKYDKMKKSIKYSTPETNMILYSIPDLDVNLMCKLFSDAARYFYEKYKIIIKENKLSLSYEFGDNIITIGNNIYFKEDNGNLSLINNLDIKNIYLEKINMNNSVIDIIDDMKKM